MEPPDVLAVNLIWKLVSTEGVTAGGIPERMRPSRRIQEGKAVRSSFVAAYLIEEAPQDSAGERMYWKYLALSALKRVWARVKL